MARNIDINQCLVFSRGIADYIGFWDVHDFIIPLESNTTIQDIIEGSSMARSVPLGFDSIRLL